MRSSVLVIVLLLLGASSLMVEAQAPTVAPYRPSPAQSSASALSQSAPTSASAPATGVSASSPAAPATPPLPSPPSGIMQPALLTVQETLSGLRVDRWKKGTIREEAGTDISSIQREIQENLPPLLKDADAAPGSLSKTIPVARHVDALYDVLLRVVEAARFAAPDEQATQLRDALTTLGNARLELSDHMVNTATGQEKQLADLRATVVKQAAFKCPAPPPEKPCPQPAPPKRRKKPATTPGNPQTQPNQPAGTKPNQPTGTKASQPSGSSQNPPQNQQNPQNQQKKQ